MAVDVVRLFVDVSVDVRLPDGPFVRVVMMKVRVDMRVDVGHRVVMVGMGMFFVDYEGHSGSHDQAGCGHARPDPVAKDENRSQGPCERGEAEQGPRSESPQAVQAFDEKDQAQSVAKRPDRESGEDREPRRNALPQGEG
jgi:hypothetical protein